MYIWQRAHWPDFAWDDSRLAPSLAALRHEQGRLLGRMEGLGFRLRAEAALGVLTENVVKSSAIEGERLDPVRVRSSIARRLGIDIGALAPTDRNVEGVVEMTLDGIERHDRPLTARRLFGWHAALFPTGHSGLARIAVGRWRDDKRGPMRVVSGPIGREKVHFTAPPAERLDSEMAAFLAWFNRKDEGLDPVAKAGIAHFWFVTIHPFGDGNGRIARAIADMVLARAEQSRQRFYSMSAQIQRERKDYYDRLERSQKGPLDITAWLDWFFGCLHRAIAGADTGLAHVVAKARFWERHGRAPLNPRQIAVLNRVLDGFEGKLTSSKWARLAKCSQDTAGRDIAGLLDLGILVRGAAGGRSTSYDLARKGEGEKG